MVTTDSISMQSTSIHHLQGNHNVLPGDYSTIYEVSADMDPDHMENKAAFSCTSEAMMLIVGVVAAGTH